MTYIKKPKIDLPGRDKNAIGLSLRDYEGGLSTLCAGCGHDSSTAAIVQAFFELAIPPEDVIKLAVVAFRPDVIASVGIDQLRSEPHPVASLAHATLYYVTHT